MIPLNASAHLVINGQESVVLVSQARWVFKIICIIWMRFGDSNEDYNGEPNAVKETDGKNS